MPTKMITSNFGAIKFDSGTIPAGNGTAPPGSMTAEFWGGQLYGTGKNDDIFYLRGSGDNVSAGTFITYDQHDLRDLLENGECLANAMINVQRMKETPHVIQCYNVPPNQNIYEAVVVTNTKLNFQNGKLDGTNLFQLFKGGFDALQGNTGGNNANKLDAQREILYAERRVYAQDTSQQFTAPASMGQMGGADASTVTTRWLNNWVLMDRTVAGEADMIIGPELNIYRFVWVASYARSNQNVSTSTPSGVVAQEFVERDSQTLIVMPAFAINVIGDKRALTATEKAIEYSNVFLANQNVPSP